MINNKVLVLFFNQSTYTLTLRHAHFLGVGGGFYFYRLSINSSAVGVLSIKLGIRLYRLDYQT